MPVVNYKSSIASQKLGLSLFGIAFSTSFLLSLAISDHKIRMAHDEERWLIGWQSATLLLKRNFDLFHPDKKYISSYRYYKAVPIIGDNALHCPKRRNHNIPKTKDCFIKNISEHPGSYVILGINNFESPEVERMIPENLFVDQLGQFRLFGPLSNENLISPQKAE